MFKPKPFFFLSCATLTVALAALPALAQSAPSSTKSTGYSQPPQNILDVMRAPSTPTPSLNPTRDRMILVSWEEHPSIARVATPFLRLAGTRIQPKNHSKHDTPGGYGLKRAAIRYELVKLPEGTTTRVQIPEGGCPGSPMWSADGKRFAFQNVTSSSVELWVGDADTGAVRRMDGVWLNQALESEVQWMPDQKNLLVKLVPGNLGNPPVKPEVPAGPSIQESIGGKGQSSTYETRDTLSNPHDEDLFDYYATSQLALVDTTTGAVKPIGEPNRYTQLEPAPGGGHLLVSFVHKPYSYVTTYERFPLDTQVWDLNSPGSIQRQTLASIPLADRVPVHGVPMGPRDFTWRPDAPATVCWTEALDNGDWQSKVPHRDKLMTLSEPFTGKGEEVLRTEMRFAGLSFSEKKGIALVSEYDMNRQWYRSSLINPDDAKQAPKVLWDLSMNERYANPGNPVWRIQPNGTYLVRQEGDFIFLSGNGSSPEGDRPFLDRFNLRTLKTERLFRSGKTEYERFLAFTGKDSKAFMTWHQSPTDVPNIHLRSLGTSVKAAAGEAQFASKRSPVTHFPDPTPALRQIQKRLVKYKRADGMDLSFTLYTPPGYKEGTRVPTILYAYPLDYADASKAGQVSGSQYTFTRLSNYRLLLLAGYAIIDNASFPIVGDPKKAYDTYTEQLVADAKAALDKAVELGVADPERIGVTGHSHGALMTANLLAHSDLFRAGVATSGSYNKTLTPFGFQSERRSVWESPDVYRQVSTFFFADKIKSPLLIMHGADDANPGTTPIQATKLYEAIRGNGGTTRLVMLPHEPHWYTAKESNEQLVYEMLNWFDAHVKNAPPKKQAAK